MTELQQLRTQAQWLDERLAEVVEGIPELKELLGEDFFTQRPATLVGNYPRQVSQRINKVRAGLLNLKSFEENAWPEAMLKLFK